MRTVIRQVGTSKGIIIPATLLKQYEFEGELDLHAGEDGILLRPIAPNRDGWDEDAKAISEAGDDVLLIPDLFDDETIGEPV